MEVSLGEASKLWRLLRRKYIKSLDSHCQCCWDYSTKVIQLRITDYSLKNNSITFILLYR